MKNTPTWLDYITAAGAILTPLLVAVLGVIGLKIRNNLERGLELESKLIEDRIKTYDDMLEPFIMLLMSDAAWKSDPKNRNRDKNEIAQQNLLSLDYRRRAFKMSLVAPDAVVIAYDNLMQYFFQRADKEDVALTQDDYKEMLTLVGTFLLEIRKSMGNEATKLNHWQMLEWFITDTRSLQAR